MTLVGIDGCPAGWVAARFDGGFSFFLSNRLEDLVRDGITVVDIPFGLIDTHPRSADVAARNHLRAYRKASSVFPSPLRAALQHTDYFEANNANRSLCGKGVTRQAFNLFERIRQAEALAPISDIYEGHPELSFAIWSQQTLMPKRSLAGVAARLALVRSKWPEFQLPTLSGATADDVLDAVALVWTADRISRGEHVTFPDPPSVTAEGVRSTIYA